MTTQNTDIAKIELTQSERFTQKVITEFTGSNGTLPITNHQKRLVQNYFITIDQALKAAEEKRLKKSEKSRDPLPIQWSNINMEQLALRVVSCARLGLDPSLSNHINMMPVKNNSAGNYSIVFITGYSGLEIISSKYGLEIPKDKVVELVFSNDKFKPIKKDIENKIESYHFKISENPFDRGEVIGGFYYHVFEDATKNRLVFWPKSEIEKRKPAYASAEFWGGEKDVWKDGKVVGKEAVEGWYNEMAWKTLKRASEGSITIDSQKIDDDYIRLSEHENSAGQLSESEKALENRNLSAGKQPETVKTEDITFEDVTKQPEPKQEKAQTTTEIKPELFPE